MSQLPKGRAPNYRLREAFGELPQGAFVRPVEYRYLPSHIKNLIFSWYDHTEDVYCYTAKGFISIPRKLLEAT